MAIPAFTGLKAWGNYLGGGGGSGGPTTTTTGTITTTAGRGLLALISGQATNNTPSFNDSKGNTWDKVASLQNGTDATAVYLCGDPANVGTGHSFTSTWTDGYSSVVVLELDRPVSLDAFSTQTDSGTPWDGSIVSTQADCLIGTATTVYATAASWALAATGWTWYGQLPDPSEGSDWDIGLLTQNAASAGTKNISMTGTDVDGGTAHHLIMFSLADASGGGVSVPLTGQAITLAQGALGVRESLSLTGQVVGAAQGTLGIAKSLGLTGQSLGVTGGNLGLQVSLSLAGQSLTLTSGNLGKAKSLGLTGQTLVFSQGNLTAGGDVAVGLSGAETVVQAGTVSPRLSLALSGQPAVLSQGTLSARIAAALTGQPLTFGSGQLTPVNLTPIGVPLVGTGLQLRQGFVTPVGGQGSGSTALRRWAEQIYSQYFRERDAKKLEDQARQIEANIVDRKPAPVPKKPKATILVRPEPPVPVIQAFPWLKAEPTVPRIVMPDFKAQSAQIQALLKKAAAPSPAPSDDEDEELLLMALI